MTSHGKDSEPADGPARPAGTVNELLMTGLELAQVLERALRERVGLSVNQFNVLRVVAGRGPGAAHAVDLTRVLGLSSAHATTVLQQLEQRGLVERHESATDRRRRSVHLTAQGRQSLQAAMPLLAGLEDRLAGALPDGGQRAALQVQLRQVRLALRHGLTAQEWDDCVGP